MCHSTSLRMCIFYTAEKCRLCVQCPIVNALPWVKYHLKPLLSIQPHNRFSTIIFGFRKTFHQSEWVCIFGSLGLRNIFGVLSIHILIHLASVCVCVWCTWVWGGYVSRVVTTFAVLHSFAFVFCNSCNYFLPIPVIGRCFYCGSLWISLDILAFCTHTHSPAFDCSIYVLTARISKIPTIFFMPFSFCGSLSNFIYFAFMCALAFPLHRCRSLRRFLFLCVCCSVVVQHGSVLMRVQTSE